MFICRIVLMFVLIVTFGLTSVYAQVRLSPEDADKLVIEKADPVYPSFAKLMKHQGTVKVEITVSEAGAVVSSKVLEGNPTLRAAALDAVKKRRYKPYIADDKPTRFITIVNMVFSLGIPQDEIERQQGISKKYLQEDKKCRDLLKSRKLKEAEQVCKAAAQVAEQLSGDRVLEKMGAYQLVGHVLMHQQRYQEALDNYSRALDYAQLTLTDKNAEMGQLYGHLALAHQAINNLDKARELYKKAEKSLLLALADMACDNCDEEVNNIRQDYLKTLKNLLEYHLIAAQQAGAAAEVEEIKKLRQNLPK